MHCGCCWAFLVTSCRVEVLSVGVVVPGWAGCSRGSRRRVGHARDAPESATNLPNPSLPARHLNPPSTHSSHHSHERLLQAAERVRHDEGRPGQATSPDCFPRLGLRISLSLTAIKAHSGNLQGFRTGDWTETRGHARGPALGGEVVSVRMEWVAFPPRTGR